MNPGINPYPDGLFWTTPIGSGAVVARPSTGEAIYKVSNLLIGDFGDFGNSFGGGAGAPAQVSFEVRWSGVDERLNIEDPDSGFGGEFVRGRAQMAWSAVVGNYAFESAPLNTSSSDFAELGMERNGSFFGRG